LSTLCTRFTGATDPICYDPDPLGWACNGGRTA